MEEAVHGVRELLESAQETEKKVLELVGTRDHLTTNSVVLHVEPHPFAGLSSGVGRQVE